MYHHGIKQTHILISYSACLSYYCVTYQDLNIMVIPPGSAGCVTTKSNWLGRGL